MRLWLTFESRKAFEVAGRQPSDDAIRTARAIRHGIREGMTSSQGTSPEVRPPWLLPRAITSR